jgi:hypothetical protein
MTRSLLVALLLAALVVLALGGALIQLVRGQRPLLVAA